MAPVIDWNALFAPETPWLELFIRGTVTFFVLMVLMRFVGQREARGLGLSDLLVVVLVGSAAGISLTGDGDKLQDGLIPGATVLFWSVAVDAAAYRWPRLARILKGHPRSLIIDGRLNRHAMRREFISLEELESQLRVHGFDDVSQVRRAYLEPGGELSFVPYDHDKKNTGSSEAEDS
jgi:uncharacterized membrane protein YcaP (DUF421 family)